MINIIKNVLIGIGVMIISITGFALLIVLSYYTDGIPILLILLGCVGGVLYMFGALIREGINDGYF